MTQIDMTTTQLLDTVMEIGQHLLETGAEIYRVEESVRLIAGAYGAKLVGVYAVPTGIIASIECEDETPITRVCRIYNRGTNLNRLDRLNALSRRLCEQPMSYEDVRKELDHIKNCKTYGTLASHFAYGGGALFFTLLFGGSLREGILAFVIGFTLYFILRILERIQTNTLFTNVVGGAWIACLALIFQHIGGIASHDGIIIGSLMLLVPGLSITNSIRDIIAGDFVAGMAKFTEALLVAAGIAIGVALPLGMIGLLGGG